jgi:transcriptional regulator of heat shock response
MFTTRIWRDAGWYENADGGSGGGESGGGSDGMSLEKLQAELEQTRAALKAANKEAAERRRRLDEIEGAEAKRKEAEQTEAQKLLARAETAEKHLVETQENARRAAIRGAVLLAAAKNDFVDAEDVYKLADLANVSVGEDNTVTGAEEAVKLLAKNKPHLLKQVQGINNINAQNRGTTSAPTIDDIVQRKRANGGYVPL